MSIYIPNGSEQTVLSLILAGGTQEDFLLKLFSDANTFTSTDVTASRTETSFTGYANTANGTSNKITRSMWASGTWSGGQPTYLSISTPFVFTSTAGSQSANVYGYYLVGATSNLLYFEERFPSAPYTIVNSGDSISITLKFGLQ